ncbi:MAG TPA: sulfatase-like hydrolase/transferase [Gemmataceae bacterium]|nr:sulfatase-like hydrolase/transferase [Gemmataceae bacterium]
MRIIVAIALLLLSGVPALAGERAPNVVVICADDLGWGDVGFNGRKQWQTPNLDKLAKRGIKFSRWYTAAVVCAPSRAALMTGKYTIHNGVVANNGELPRSETTLAAALKRLGYVTALFGKWHHGVTLPGEKSYIHPLDRGFDEFFGYTNAKHAWEKFPKQAWHGRELKDVPVGSYADTMFTDKSLDFVKRNNDRPFFLYLAFVAPHFHVEAPEEDVKPFVGKFKEKDKKNTNANYAGMVTRLDKEVGRLMKQLDDLGLTENTIIVFTSDHGATFEVGNAGASMYHRSNFPFRGQKRTLWEGGIRVPALVAWKGKLPAGRTIDEPMHMTDLFPTLLAAAKGKVDPAAKIDGHNMLAFWKGEAKAPERTLFWEWRQEKSYQLAAMRGPIKFIFETKDGKAKMYNVVEDPGETRDIIQQHPELARQLEQELRTWLATERNPAKSR